MIKAQFLCFFSLIFLSCSSDPVEPPVEEANVETEVILFNYQQNLEENSFVLEFNVKHTNKSNFQVNGFSRIEVKTNRDSFTYVFLREISEVNCATMAKGEVCFDSYYRSGDLGSPDTYGPEGPHVIELVSATYVLNQE